MPIDVTEPPVFDPTVSAPLGGEPRTAASVRTPLTSLAKRTRWALAALSGAMQWSGGAYTAAGAGLGVFVTPPKGLVVGLSMLSLSADTEVPSASLTASAWAYVFGYDDAGALALQASLDAPEAARLWKSTGVGTHRYLCAIRRDASTGIVPFERRSGETRWRSALAVLTNGANTGAPASVDFSAWAPPHARMLVLQVKLTDTASSGGFAQLRRNGDAAAPVTLTVGASGTMTCEITVPCDAAQLVAYSVSNVDLRVTLTPLGWRE